MTDKSLVDFVKDANDLAKLMTGRSIIGLFKRSSELFGRDVAKRLMQGEPEESEDSPYRVLEVRRGASMIVVKATYRELIKGKTRGSAEYEKIHSAYLEIMHERGEG